MKKPSYILFWVSLIIFLFSLAGSILLNRPIQHKTIYANVTIGDKLGFDVSENSLIFGILPSGSTSTRSVIFTNENDFEVLVKIKATGNIAPLLDFEETVSVKPKEQKNIGITAVSGENELGDYVGFVEFKVFPA